MQMQLPRTFSLFSFSAQPHPQPHPLLQSHSRPRPFLAQRRFSRSKPSAWNDLTGECTCKIEWMWSYCTRNQRCVDVCKRSVVCTCNWDVVTNVFAKVAQGVGAPTSPSLSACSSLSREESPPSASEHCPTSFWQTSDHHLDRLPCLIFQLQSPFWSTLSNSGKVL